MASEITSTLPDNLLADSDNLVPNAEELENLYLLLEKSVIPELQWQNPGRIQEENKVEQTTVVESSETIQPVKTDFDFSDDVAQPQMRVRTQTPKSAKKKTANFADILKKIG